MAQKAADDERRRNQRYFDTTSGSNHVAQDMS
jgi:hypothetical protein